MASGQSLYSKICSSDNCNKFDLPKVNVSVLSVSDYCARKRTQFEKIQISETH